MSDLDPNQKAWEVTTSAGKVTVDADSAEDAAVLAREHIGGNVIDVTEIQSSTAEASDNSEDASEAAPASAPAATEAAPADMPAANPDADASADANQEPGTGAE